MKTLPFWIAILPLLPLTAAAGDVREDQKVIVSAERDSEWNSYRHAYKAAAFFAHYTRSRPLIQAHMQIRPLEASAPLNGLSLHLVGEKTDITIPVDGIGRAELPMLKQAYQDDAVLRLNRQKGNYYFSGRYSIREHADGVYDMAELRAACEQLISAQRESGYRMRLIGKQCQGIKFVYPAGAAPEVRAQTGGPSGVLPLVDAHPFEGNSMGIYKVALYRFADWPQQGKIQTVSAPLAIGTLYD